MSENILPDPLSDLRYAKNWRRFALVACIVSFLTFLGGAAAQFFLRSQPHALAAVHPMALVMGGVAAVIAGVGIYALNRYAALNTDDPFIALWTNLLCRVLVLVELLSLAALLAWMIYHVLGVPAA